MLNSLLIKLFYSLLKKLLYGPRYPEFIQNSGQRDLQILERISQDNESRN